MTAPKKPTDLDTEREKRGLPVERWRRGIYAALITRPKAGIVKAFKAHVRPMRSGRSVAPNDDD